MTPQQKLQDDILGILYKNKSDESDEGSWIGSEDYHKVADELVSLLLPSEDFKYAIADAASKVWNDGFFSTKQQFIEHALAFATLGSVTSNYLSSHFQHELQLLCEKVYAYAHMNKSAGYNGEDDKGREREPERGSIYEIAKSYLPYRHPHEKGLRKKLFPCAFSQCENETELHIDIWGKRQYVCEYHLSSIIDKLESDDTDL